MKYREAQAVGQAQLPRSRSRFWRLLRNPRYKGYEWREGRTNHSPLVLQMVEEPRHTRL